MFNINSPYWSCLTLPPGTFPLKQSDGKGPGRCWYRYGFVTCVDHAITWRPCRAICMLKAKYITGSMAECKRSFGVCIFGSLIWGTVVQSFDIQQDKEFICVWFAQMVLVFYSFFFGQLVFYSWKFKVDGNNVYKLKLQPNVELEFIHEGMQFGLHILRVTSLVVTFTCCASCSRRIPNLCCWLASFCPS